MVDIRFWFIQGSSLIGFVAFHFGQPFGQPFAIVNNNQQVLVPNNVQLQV